MYKKTVKVFNTDFSAIRLLDEKTNDKVNWDTLFKTLKLAKSLVSPVNHCTL